MQKNPTHGSEWIVSDPFYRKAALVSSGAQSAQEGFGVGLKEMISNVPTLPV